MSAAARPRRLRLPLRFAGMTRWLALGLVWSLAPAAASGQGLLTPPPGAPAPTQRSLAEIDARLDALDATTQAVTTRVDDILLAHRQLLAWSTPPTLPWRTTTIATVAQTGVYLALPPRIAVDPRGRIWVAYVSAGMVRVSCGDGRTWVESLPGVAAFACALAIDPAGEPVLVAGGADGTLRLVRHGPTGWGTPQSLPVATSAATGCGPELVIGPTGWVLAGAENSTLRVLRSVDGTTWAPAETLSTEFRNGLSLALDPAGRPGVGFNADLSTPFSSTLYTLVRWDGAAWQTSALGTDRSDPTFTFAPDGATVLVSRESFNALIYRDGGTVTTLLSGSDLPRGRPVFGVDREPRIIAHRQDTEEVVFLQRQGGVWHQTVVTRGPTMFQAPEIAWGRDFQPLVVFVDYPAQTIRFAQLAMFAPVPVP